MKRIAEKTILLTTFVSLFMACSPELEDTSEKTIASLQVTLNGFRGGVDTRTQESGYQTSFTGNEQIGVFALKNSGDVILENNVPYKYSAGAWQPVNTNNQIHVYGTGITYYAYYPYSSSMNDKKSVTEIISAFTLPEDQSDYDKYTSADLMTGTGTLGSGGTLAFSFVHAMSLIEIKINETSNSDAPYDPAPVFYGMAPWKMPDGIYRYLVRPGADAEVAFDYGPADNRYAYQKSLAAADVTAGNYTRIAVPFKNFSMELSTGSYGATTLGPVSKVIINGNEYAATAVGESNNKYILNGLRKIPEPLASFDVYINDNQAKEDSKEQLLVSATTTNITVDATALTVTLPLSAGGMEGAGTEADPYQVTTSPQLRGVAQNASAYYKQMEDIDLSIYANWQSKNYSGTYDGGHKNISGLTCNGRGLFSELSGTIKNAHITSGNITNNGTAGAFCANATSAGTIENCSNAATITGTVKGAGFFGGVCGELQGKILHCKNTGTILGKGEIFGGVVGWVNTGTLQYSYNAGEVKPDEPYHASKSSGVGGVAGAIYYGSPTISYCYNTGIVKHYGGAEAASGGGSVQRGEIVGWTQSDDSVNNNWYVTGTDNKPSGDNAVNSSNQGFDNANNQWPVYSTDSSNGWGSAHWKSYSQGEYPKLLWEE